MSKVTVEQIEVPEGMLNAYNDAHYGHRKYGAGDGLKAALEWLANNPIVPSEEQAVELDKSWSRGPHEETPISACGRIATEWMSQAFLRREPPVPEAVKALMWNNGPDGRCIGDTAIREHNESIIAAYKAGQAEVSK